MRPPIAGCFTISHFRRPSRYPSRHWSAMTRALSMPMTGRSNVPWSSGSSLLRRFGYEIQNKSRGDFEIKGVSAVLLEKFSKRHHQIDEKTRELLARHPQKANGNIAAIRENIAHRERPPKIRDLGMSRLQALW